MTATAPARLAATRRALHAVAEGLLAAPQYRATGTIRLAARPGGFATTRGYGDLDLVAVDGTDLLVVRSLRQRRQGTHRDHAPFVEERDVLLAFDIELIERETL